MHLLWEHPENMDVELGKRLGGWAYASCVALGSITSNTATHYHIHVSENHPV